MQTQSPSNLLVRIAAAGVLSTAFHPHAEAAPLLPSISIKFGTEQSNGAGGNSQVFGPAGTLGTVNWNNFANPSGSGTNLSLDVSGSVVASSASVLWSSPNTWSSTGAGEENNTGSGQNRNLMAGYLDTLDVGQQGVSITLSGLSSVAAFSKYDVYVYIQGGVNGRGGTYTLGSAVDTHIVTTPFSGSFIEDTDIPGTTPGSNYLVFRNVVGDSFTLNSAATTTRAPVNAIEIVSAVPEPGTAILAGAGVLLLGARRRRTHVV